MIEVANHPDFRPGTHGTGWQNATGNWCGNWDGSFRFFLPFHGQPEETHADGLLPQTLFMVDLTLFSSTAKMTVIALSLSLLFFRFIREVDEEMSIARKRFSKCHQKWQTGTLRLFSSIIGI